MRLSAPPSSSLLIDCPTGASALCHDGSLNPAAIQVTIQSEKGSDLHPRGRTKNQKNKNKIKNKKKSNSTRRPLLSFLFSLPHSPKQCNTLHPCHLPTDKI